MDVNQKCVLVVEDQFLIRLMLVEALTDAGLNVVEAMDGDTALDLLGERAGIDLVLTDIQMPGKADGNAVGTYAKLRRPGLPVIYASGREDMLKNALSQEDAFLPKPFGTQQVVTLVSELLGKVSDLGRSPNVRSTIAPGPVDDVSTQADAKG